MQRFLIGIAAVGMTAAMGMAGALAQDKGSVVVASWGGSFQDAQRETMFKPFEKETGIKVIEATGPSMAKIKSMVDSGNIEWDVSGMTPGDFLVLYRDGYTQKFDYDRYFKTMKADIVPETIHPHGIGNFFYSKVIAYNTKAFKPGEHPKSWADVWDTKKFPGPRMIDAGDWVVPPLEYALMADGVAIDKIYPIDMERAYKSMSKIKPSVVKFANKSAMAPQALVDGEAVIAAATLGRVLALKESGAPVDFEYNQGMIQFDYWMIPKGAKNYENAMKFIEFATRPEVQAALVKTQALGPVNLKAFDHLDPARAKILPSYPENLKKQLFISADWWSQADATGKSNVQKNQEMWNRWSLQ